MTAKRAAIRCGLAIGRAAYRPPWRARKVRRRHRFIVPAHGPAARGHAHVGRRPASHAHPAPPAARAVGLASVLLAASVGLVLARAERERRAATRAARKRRTSLSVDEPLAEGLRRVALGQLDLAVELLERDPRERGELSAQTVHETRKAIKRLRALMRLLAPVLGRRSFRRENGALRDCGRRLAGARDAEVMVVTLDALLRGHPQLAATRSQPGSGVRALRAELVAERDPAGASDTGGEDAIGDLRALGARVSMWDLQPPSGSGRRALVTGGIEDIYRTGRHRMRRAARRRDDPVALHAWRKSVKDLRYVAETLDRGKPARQSAAGTRVHEVARRAERLGELLGEDHDLVLLAARVRTGREHFVADRRTRKQLLELIGRRRKRLRKRALRAGARLYRRKPRAFVRRLRGAL